MQRKLCMFAMLMFVIPGLVFTASCSKKAVKPAPAAYEEKAREIVSTTSEKDKAARQRAIEEERLRQERLKKEREERMRKQGTSSGSRSAFMSDDVYFSYDSAVLSPRARNVLRQKAQWLNGRPNVSAIIEGHCDDRGTNAYNMALGDRRAESVKVFLVNLGISRSRLTTISYGEERPLDPRQNESAWAKNRRAHFVLQ